MDGGFYTYYLLQHFYCQFQHGTTTHAVIGHNSLMVLHGTKVYCLQEFDVMKFPSLHYNFLSQILCIKSVQYSVSYYVLLFVSEH